MSKYPAEKYDLLTGVGFPAGITLKGHWESPASVYGFLKNDIAPEGKKIVAPEQIHGSNIVVFDDKAMIENISADGVISRNDSCCLTVRTADCLPLLFAAPEMELFGAVHVGWRGLAGGIIENLILTLKNLDINLNQLYISLGPAIGSCCYEVGAEIAIIFDNGFVSMKDNRYYLDIRGAAMDKLISSGINKNRIQDISECTGCLEDKYYSFRRDGNAPIQMVSYIYKS